jgi:homogentisate 1,2-dioxygenase
MSDSPLHYQSGFANEFATEAVGGALPQGRNSPQRAPLQLYAELISGTAFTAPRAENRRSWLYRRQPSVVAGAYQPYAQPGWTTGAEKGAPIPPEPLRWSPFVMPDVALDFVDGIRTIAANGDVEAQVGIAAHVYLCNRSMDRRALVNADGEMLFVPQQGRVLLTTEMGVLEVRPGEIALVPRGVVFKVDLPDGPSRGYLCENYGAQFRSARTVWPMPATSSRRWPPSTAAKAATKSSRSSVAGCGVRTWRIRPSTSLPGTAT